MSSKSTTVNGGNLIVRSLLLLGSLLTVIPHSHAANTWNVPGDFATIQAAIGTAFTGDTIVVAAGNYHESLTWGGKDITLQGAGAGPLPNLTVIDPSGASGGPGGRCLFTSDLTAASTVSGFVFQSGSTSAGGGIYNNHSSPTVANCTFSGNSASVYGGAIYNESSSPALVNCTFSGNSTDSGGGGMFNDSDTSNPTLTNCTFANNQADFGGGICNFGGVTTLRNCIFWGNLASTGGGMFNDTGTPIISYSDVQDLPNATPDSDGNFVADPLFVDAPNGDLRLQLGSPCQNAGDNAVVTSPPFLSVGGIIVDLDGNPRLSGSRVDLGAYEIQENTATVANAGPDQTVSANESCQATLTLDGSASTGSALTFSWSEGASVIANGAAPQITLSAGSHLILLTVVDGQGQASSDSLLVMVQDTTAPVPSVANLPVVSGQCSVTITTAPTANDNCVGAITGVTPDPLTYAMPGRYTVIWTYDDGNGNSVTQPQIVIVQGPQTPTPTTLTYNGATSSTPGAASVTLSATLTSGTGKKTQKLASQLITFTLGTSTTHSHTDATGTARVTVTAPALAGTYPLSASFAGDCYFAPSTVSKTFTVKRK